jgi:hypothetical protein
VSNVLIGIIGVILFIGLALAGALILGDDFRTASSSSKAAAVTQTMQQVAAAANMYQMKKGRVMMASEHSTAIDTLVAAKSLRIVATNPMNGNPIALVNSGGGMDTVSPGRFFYTNLGTDGVSRDVCRQIEETMGNPDPDAALAPVADWGARTSANRRMGCLLYSYYQPAVYQAYIPLN